MCNHFARVKEYSNCHPPHERKLVRMFRNYNGSSLPLSGNCWNASITIHNEVRPWVLICQLVKTVGVNVSVNLSLCVGPATDW